MTEERDQAAISATARELETTSSRSSRPSLCRRLAQRYSRASRRFNPQLAMKLTLGDEFLHSLVSAGWPIPPAVLESLAARAPHVVTPMHF
jgi:hypothetical protein